MALGREDLEELRNKCDLIEKELPILEDCWNTFQYVFKKRDDMTNWADNTNIGKELQTKIVNNCDYMHDRLFPNLRERFLKVMYRLIDEQERNNGGNI